MVGEPQIGSRLGGLAVQFLTSKAANSRPLKVGGLGGLARYFLTSATAFLSPSTVKVSSAKVGFRLMSRK